MLLFCTLGSAEYDGAAADEEHVLFVLVRARLQPAPAAEGLRSHRLLLLLSHRGSLLTQIHCGHISRGRHVNRRSGII